jgi:hypothetical protein
MACHSYCRARAGSWREIIQSLDLHAAVWMTLGFSGPVFIAVCVPKSRTRHQIDRLQVFFCMVRSDYQTRSLISCVSKRVSIYWMITGLVAAGAILKSNPIVASFGKRFARRTRDLPIDSSSNSDNDEEEEKDEDDSDRGLEQDKGPKKVHWARKVTDTSSRPAQRQPFSSYRS